MKRQLFRLLTCLAWVGAALLCPLTSPAQPTVTWRHCVTVPRMIGGGATDLHLTSAGQLAMLVSYGNPIGSPIYFGWGTSHYTLAGIFADTLRFDRSLPPLTSLYREAYLPGGDHYVIGNYSNGPQHGTSFLARFDSLNRMRWRTDLDTVGSYQRGLVALPNGALICTGRGVLRNGMNWNDVVIRRLDAAGRVQLLDTIGANYSSPRDLEALPDGSYVAVLTDPSRRFGPQGRFTHDHLLVRLHASGAVLDTVWVGQPDDHDEANVVRPTADGGLVLAGWRAVPPAASAPRQGLLVKLDSAWREQWRLTTDYTFSSGSYSAGDELFDVQALANGHYLVGGGHNGPWLAEVAPPVGPGAPPTIVWETNYQALTPPLDFINSQPEHILVQPPGTAYVLGRDCNGPFSTDRFDWLARYDNLSAGPAMIDMCARPPVLTDSARWARVGSRADSLVFSLNPVTTFAGPRYGEVSLVTWDFGDGTPADTGWTVRHRFATPAPVRVRCCVTNNLFCVTCQDLFPYGVPVGLSEAQALAASVSVYPNPSTSGVFTVRTGGGPETRSTFTVTDAVGRAVASGVLAGVETTLDLRAQPAGVYALRLRWAGGRAVSKRLVCW